MRSRIVGVSFDLQSQATRRVITGIARYAGERGTWRLASDASIGARAFNPEQLESVDGVIASSARAAWGRTRPVILVGTPYGSPEYPMLCADNEAIGKLAATHLLSLGLPSMGFVGLKPAPWSRGRLEGYSSELERRNHCCTVLEFDSGDATFTETPAPKMVSWLRQLSKPCALFCADDRIAALVANVAVDLGFRVPEQVAVLGVNNDDLCCSAVVPPLSSIATGAEQIGYAAAQYLERAMDGEALPHEVLLRVPPRGVIERGSTQIVGYTEPVMCNAIRLIKVRVPREALTVDQLAACLDVPHQQLSRLFHTHIGRSPKEEIDRLRGEYLHGQLFRGTKAIKRIAYEIGFASSAELSRFCRRVLSRTGTEIRAEGRRASDIGSDDEPEGD